MLALSVSNSVDNSGEVQNRGCFFFKCITEIKAQLGNNIFLMRKSVEQDGETPKSHCWFKTRSDYLAVRQTKRKLKLMIKSEDTAVILGVVLDLDGILLWNNLCYGWRVSIVNYCISEKAARWDAIQEKIDYSIHKILQWRRLPLKSVCVEYLSPLLWKCFPETCHSLFYFQK